MESGESGFGDADVIQRMVDWGKNELEKFVEDPDVNWMTEEIHMAYLEAAQSTTVVSFMQEGLNSAATVQFRGAGSEGKSCTVAFECTAHEELHVSYIYNVYSSSSQKSTLTSMKSCALWPQTSSDLDPPQAIEYNVYLGGRLAMEASLTDTASRSHTEAGPCP